MHTVFYKDTLLAQAIKNFRKFEVKLENEESIQKGNDAKHHNLVNKHLNFSWNYHGFSMPPWLMNPGTYQKKQRKYARMITKRN